MQAVAVFTDTYLPTINGVSYTIAEWRHRWQERGGRMDVVHPRPGPETADRGEVSVPSIPFPFYPGYRIGLPQLPSTVRDVDLVHVHSPFTVGFAGIRLAHGEGLPVVASYHTPTSEYLEYLLPVAALGRVIEPISRQWERIFYEQADAVVTPSAQSQSYVENDIGVSTPVEAISNGVDVERFRPTDPTEFLDRLGLEPTEPIVGYTGRHGYEKRLSELLVAAEEVDATVLFGGDGPARGALEAQAADLDADVRFLGYLDREDLPAFYSGLDVFVFPSPVETQGIVALEAMACGTPVVGANRGALVETIDPGVTGYLYESGDPSDLVETIERALTDLDRLEAQCRERRETLSLERTIDELTALYDSLGA